MALINNQDDPPRSTGSVVSYASFGRPADTTDYTAGDVVSNSSAVASVIHFPGCGNRGFVVNAHVQYEETHTINFELWVFDVEPTNFLDNVAFALVSADLPKIVARFNCLDANKTTVGTDINHYPASGENGEAMAPHSYVSASGSLFGLLVTRSPFPPLSNAKIKIRISLASA